MNQKISAIEAFRSFDQDFDGMVSKSDMKKSLIEFIKVKPAELSEIRLDRLIKLLSFFKTENIQQSDFDRLLKDSNPFLTAATGSTSTTFKSSMGGGFSNVSALDWKFAAIQQIGLTISQKYSSLE